MEWKGPGAHLARTGSLERAGPGCRPARSRISNGLRGDTPARNRRTIHESCANASVAAVSRARPALVVSLAHRAVTRPSIPLPAGLKESGQLPEPIFTPATKATTGHDENISFEKSAEILGTDVAAKVRDLTLDIYRRAAEFARERGIIIADTKFEFGLDEDGTLTLIDEVLTPDSSRFWPVDTYRPGTSPPSFDKQFVRDYLETLDWDKRPPAPHLPADVIRRTSEKYQEALLRLTGEKS